MLRRNARSTATLLAVAAMVLSLAGVQAQERQYRVAVLTPGAILAPVLTALKEGLAQLGLQEGRNITFVVEETAGEVSGLPERTARLLALNPDLLFTVGTEPTAAAKQATTHHRATNSDTGTIALGAQPADGSRDWVDDPAQRYGTR